MLFLQYFNQKTKITYLAVKNIYSQSELQKRLRLFPPSRISFFDEAASSFAFATKQSSPKRLRFSISLEHNLTQTFCAPPWTYVRNLAHDGTLLSAKQLESSPFCLRFSPSIKEFIKIIVTYDHARNLVLRMRKMIWFTVTKCPSQIMNGPINWLVSHLLCIVSPQLFIMPSCCSCLADKQSTRRLIHCL